MLSRIEEARAIIRKGSLRDVLEVKNQADLVRAYTAKHDHLQEASVELSEVAVRATRRAGEILNGMEKAAPGEHWKKKRSPGRTATPTLRELGITKNQSSKWQKIASVPDDVFDAHVTKCLKAKKQITVTSVAKLAPIDTTAKQREPDAEFDSGIVTDLAELLWHQPAVQSNLGDRERWPCPYYDRTQEGISWMLKNRRLNRCWRS